MASSLTRRAPKPAKDRPQPTHTSATYVYGIVDGERPPRVPRTLPTLPGAGHPRVLAVSEGRWLLVADVPLTEYGDTALPERLRNARWVAACGLAHHDLVSRFVRSHAVVPMTPFTIFASDERAIRQAHGAAKRLNATVRLVQHRGEWSFRVYAPKSARRAPVASAAAAAPARKTPPTTGTIFLQRKLEFRKAAADAAQATRAATETAYAELEALADRAHRRPETESLSGSALSGSGLAGSGLLLDAAFLLPLTQARAFATTARALARRLTTLGLEVSFSGPWPAYSFIESSRVSRGGA